MAYPMGLERRVAHMAVTAHILEAKRYVHNVDNTSARVHFITDRRVYFTRQLYGRGFNGIPMHVHAACWLKQIHTLSHSSCSPSILLSSHVLFA